VNEDFPPELFNLESFSSDPNYPAMMTHVSSTGKVETLYRSGNRWLLDEQSNPREISKTNRGIVQIARYFSIGIVLVGGVVLLKTKRKAAKNK
jgi:hypothetical protein